MNVNDEVFYAFGFSWCFLQCYDVQCKSKHLIDTIDSIDYRFKYNLVY